MRSLGYIDRTPGRTMNTKAFVTLVALAVLACTLPATGQVLLTSRPPLLGMPKTEVTRDHVESLMKGMPKGATMALDGGEVLVRLRDRTLREPSAKERTVMKPLELGMWMAASKDPQNLAAMTPDERSALEIAQNDMASKFVPGTTLVWGDGAQEAHLNDGSVHPLTPEQAAAIASFELLVKTANARVKALRAGAP